MEKYSKDLIAASTIPIILSILSKGDNYGYQILKEVQVISNGSLNWKEGSLYPVLTKLEKKGLIKSFVKKENGRNRKYYTIKEDGKTFLINLKNEWNSLNNILTSLWKEQINLTYNMK